MNYMFDLKYAWRLLIKSWGYSLLCVIVVALSLGLALWTYALVYSQGLKPLPFPGASDWYSIQIATDENSDAGPNVDTYTYQEILARSDDVEHLGAYSGRTVLLSEGQASVSLRAAAISPTLLTATSVKPHMGRLFSAADSEAGAAPAVILGYEIWKNYFASDPSVVGKQTRINSKPVQIIGVMSKDFRLFRDYEIWLPLQLTNLVAPTESTEYLAPFFVLGEGQNLDAVTKKMTAAVEDGNKRYPKLFNEKRALELFPARLTQSHSALPVIAIIGFLALAILLLGCVNISLVFLARLLERSRELALRTALGASRARLMRQCLMETALIVVLGLGIGYALAWLGVAWTIGLSEFKIQILSTGRSWNALALNTGDLVVAVGIAIAIWLLSTLVPAWRIAKQDAAIALAGTGKGAAVRGGSKGTGFLIGLQVLISSMVMVVCMNLVLAINAEANKPMGMNIDGILVTTKPSVFDGRYAEPNQRLRYWDDLEAGVKAKMPGATVAYSTSIPVGRTEVAVAIESQQGANNQGELALPIASVSDGYFDMLGIKLRSGRLFDNTDNESSIDAAVIDEKTASRYWPGQNALGKRIQLNPADNGPYLTVVGIASGVAGPPYSPDNGIVYRPMRQALPEAFHAMIKLPKSVTGDSRVALRAVAFELDREIALHNLQNLDHYAAAVNSNYKGMIPVFTAITAITAILAATGLFGLISRSVAQRTQEVGIRRALGATQWQSISIFRRQAVVYLVVGVVGLILGVVVTSLISSAFSNVLDLVLPVSVAVLLLISAVIFAASYLPTRRAVALEPGDALRYE